MSRVDQEGWGWVGNGRNGGQEGLEGTNTEQHNEESQTFGHQRQMDSIRWPAPDCGLERIRAIVGWIGSVTGIVQLSKSHQASVAVLSAQWQEDLGGVGEKEPSVLTEKQNNTETKRRGGAQILLNWRRQRKKWRSSKGYYYV